MKSIKSSVRDFGKDKSGPLNLERSTAINSCNGVFTSEFIFR